ncbi:MAG: hypothetical protein IRY85_02450 [Micromonosporaceae bacterium]|nr:hypothetical protein [Micromonosporaceae bacterium]
MNRSSVRPLVWVIAAVAVTATATALITASLVADDSVRSPQQVADALAAATTTPTTSTPTTSGTPGTATSTTTVVGGAGDLTSTLTPGIVTVHCDGALASLVGWSPNPGWRADDPVRGPAAEVSVRFESDVAADYKVTATCAQGVPVVNLGPDDHHGGGDDDDDHRGRGRGSDDY